MEKGRVKGRSKERAQVTEQGKGGELSSERLTVSPDRSFMVFLIGARVNRWWLIPVIWAVSRAMGRMMEELSRDPSAGLLGYESYGGRTTLMLQYWRSEEDLLAYARDKERQHVPAWRQWIRRWGLDGAIGIWHETYVVDPGRYECVYHHMPPFGLGKVAPRIPAVGPLKTAAGRLAAGQLAAERQAAEREVAERLAAQSQSREAASPARAA